MDISALAAAAVATVVPYLVESVTGIAKKAGDSLIAKLGETAVKKAEGLWNFLQQKLTKPAQQDAIAKLEKQPDDPEVQASVRVHLKEAMTDDPEIAAALEKLLQGVSFPQGGQIADVRGSGHKVGQADRGSIVTIS